MLPLDAAQNSRQLVRGERDSRDDAEAAAASALEPPEELGIRARVGDADLAVGGHDLGLEQARRGHAEVLREAAEAAALDQARDADRAAAAALDVAAAARRDGVVGLEPSRAGFDRDGRRAARRPAALRHERVVQGDRVHVARPDQQRVRRVRGALVAVPAALDDEPQAVRRARS